MSRCQNRLVELVRTVLLDRVVEWYKAEVMTAAGGGSRGKGKGAAGSNSTRQSARRAAGAGADDGSSDGGEGAVAAAAAAAEGVGSERVSSVWSLLAKTGQGDAHKCLKKVNVHVRWFGLL